MIDEKKNYPNVSVIIPMYKCASFVSNLLDMVCGQTLKDIEIICVLDGPDEALQSIVEERASQDKRISCIVQEHSNAGTARNTGMDAAKGDYLLFLDADDIFEPEMAEKMYSKAVEMDAEIVMCSYSQIDGRTEVSAKVNGYNYSIFFEDKTVDCTEMEALYDSFMYAAWNKLFRRQSIESLGIRFSETRMMNDVFFVTSAVSSCRRMAVIKEELLTVKRYANADSISSNREKYNEDTILVLEEIYDWLKINGHWNRRKNDYIKITKDTLAYEASYEYNEKFIDETARLLSTKKPWKHMSNVKMAHMLELRISEIKRIRNNLSDEITALNTLETNGRKYRLSRAENRLRNVREIRALMKTKYGRDLSKRDNPIALLSWSLESRGWRGTMRKLKDGLSGEILLEPSNMICSGHITTAGHYLTFFIPVETYRDEAIVEELSVAVRCNGYYPIAVSGKDGARMTALGPRKTQVINAGASTRKGEVMRAYTEVSPGLGIFVQLRFAERLLRNKNGREIDNNRPISAQIEGKIRLK